MLPKLVPNYVLAALAVSVGGFINGFDTGSIGAVTAMSQFTQSVGILSSSLLGFTVSLIMLTGAVPSVFAGYLADKFGRLKIIICGAVLFGIGALLQGSSHGLSQFITGRALGGLGEGVYLSTVSVYICEIAPVKFRGTLTGLPPFMASAGVCIGYFTCYGSVHSPASMAWRIPYVLQCGLAVMLALSCLVFPESPRWLVLHGQAPKALQALQRLDFPMVEAEQDFLTATEQRPSLSPWQSFKLLFSKPYRMRTTLAFFILGMIQLSGIDGVLYYAPKLFSQAGISSATASFLASGLSAILMLAASIPAFLLADRWGRRTSAISGGLGLSGCMLLMGSLYAAGAVHPHGVGRWVVIIAVFVFGITYCSTWAIVGKIYASEIQPAHTRAAANCVAQGPGFITNWLVAIITPILLEKSAFGAYFLFGGLALGTVVVLALCMPETRGRSLEDIQAAFHHPGLKSLSTYLHPLMPSGRSRHHQRHVSAGADPLAEMEPRRGGDSTSSAPGLVAPRGLRVDVATTTAAAAAAA